MADASASCFVPACPKPPTLQVLPGPFTACYLHGPSLAAALRAEGYPDVRMAPIATGLSQSTPVPAVALPAAPLLAKPCFVCGVPARLPLTAQQTRPTPIATEPPAGPRVKRGPPRPQLELAVCVSCLSGVCDALRRQGAYDIRIGNPPLPAWYGNDDG